MKDLNINSGAKKTPFSPDMTMIVVVAIFLVSVAFGGTLVQTLHSIVSYQENSAKYINISGQQRMLSQRLALYSLMFAESGELKYQQQAELALKKIKSNLNYLLDESREDVMMSDRLFNMYYRPPLAVKTSLLNYLSAIERVISVSQEQIDNHEINLEKQYILENVTPILTKLDTVVQQYELESGETVDRLKTLEFLMLASFLLFSLLILFFVIIPWLKKNREKQALLHAAASSDHLTKLLNRKALAELEELIFDECEKATAPISALMIDIDYFKQVNDQYGHAIGDKVLVEVSSLIRRSLRESDYCFRYGGEEFLVILPHTNLEHSMSVAEKIKDQVNNTEIEHDDFNLSVTLSIGVSAKDTGDHNLNKIIERADIAMYRAKNQGRNRIVYC